MWDYKSLAKRQLGEGQIDVKSIWRIEDAHLNKAKRKVKLLKVGSDTKIDHINFFIPPKIKVEEDAMKQAPYTPASTPINNKGCGNG